MDEKVYQVTVTYLVYGQTNKAAAKDYIEESRTDGLVIEKISQPEIVKPKD